jgi:hypothetical protein
MKVHGSCHCGHVRYEAEVDPALASLCHCTDCQKLTGSVYRVTVPAPAETFRLLSGRTKVYVKTAQSGTRRRHAFCPDCGTPVSASADADDPPVYSLRIGCLAERALLPPQRRIWCDSALPWSLDVSGVAGVARQ